MYTDAKIKVGFEPTLLDEDGMKGKGVLLQQLPEKLSRPRSDSVFSVVPVFK